MRNVQPVPAAAAAPVEFLAGRHDACFVPRTSHVT